MCRGGVRHDKALLTAIRLIDGDVEVAAVAGGIQVINHKGARRHAGFVEQITGLADCYSCTGAGNTANHRRITALGLRQHAIVGTQLHTPIRQGVEDLATGVGLAHGQLAAQAGDVTLRVGIEGLVVLPSFLLPAHRAVMAQAPVAEVQAGVQPQVSRIVITEVGSVVVAVEGVAQGAGSDATVPQFRADIAPGITAQGDLRNTDVE